MTKMRFRKRAIAFLSANSGDARFAKAHLCARPIFAKGSFRQV